MMFLILKKNFNGVVVKNREVEFKKDLKALLEKYNAFIDVTYETLPYGVDIKGILVGIPEVICDDGSILAEECYIQFTKYLDEDCILE